MRQLGTVMAGQDPLAALQQIGEAVAYAVEIDRPRNAHGRLDYEVCGRARNQPPTTSGGANPTQSEANSFRAGRFGSFQRNANRLVHESIGDTADRRPCPSFPA